ncbi:MAG: DNA polymerase/3'-5' exonuclease PolX [Gemmatimonadetes bacterium]|nr:DNA polymerase/3'-5' exonuclease PolX [Gemmatimonadota bacterium]
MSEVQLQPSDVARVLADIATLMELNGRDPFRAKAFASAARALEGSDADLRALAKSDQLTSLRGIGPAIASIVAEIVLTGRSRIREELDAATPIGLFDLLQIPGLGPKRIRTLYTDLGVDSLDSLERVASEGRLASVAGFGQKTADKVLAGLSFARECRGRRRYPEALESAARIVDWLRARGEVSAAEIVGALRRRLEVIERIDLVASSAKPERTLTDFAKLNGVSHAEREDADTVTARLTDGMTARLRCVPAGEFVGAVIWETGNEAHLSRLAEMATGRGLVLDRSGLRRGSARVPLPAEESLYSALELAYVAPELREGLGEVEAAATSVLELVELEDLRGTFHCHTTYSDGKATVQEMAEAADALEWSYLGLADHSRSAGYAGGLSVEQVREQQAEIDAWNEAAAASGRSFRLFKGVESDILPDGSLDYPDAVLASFDYVVASVHSGFAMAREEMTARMLRAVRNPYLTILGHPTGRLLLTRKGYDVDVRQLIDAAAERGVIIEINANPHRLDLDWREVRVAAAKGVLIAINPDAHSVNALQHVAYGVNMARKAGLAPEQILNCWPLDRVERYIAERKQAREA